MTVDVTPNRLWDPPAASDTAGDPTAPMPPTAPTARTWSRLFVHIINGLWNVHIIHRLWTWNVYIVNIVMECAHYQQVMEPSGGARHGRRADGSNAANGSNGQTRREQLEEFYNGPKSSSCSLLVANGADVEPFVRDVEPFVRAADREEPRGRRARGDIRYLR